MNLLLSEDSLNLPGCLDNRNCFVCRDKVKVYVLRPVQQPGSNWDGSAALPPVGVEPTQSQLPVTDAKLTKPQGH